MLESSVTLRITHNIDYMIKESPMKINAMKAWSLKKSFTSLLLAVFTLLSVQTPAMAAIVSTDQVAYEQQSQMQREAVKSFLSRDDVATQLVERGVDVADAQQRVDSLTSAELNALSEKIDLLPAGEGAAGLVIGIIVVFMLLDIAGVTDIFPAI